LRQQLGGAQGQQIRRAGAGADQIDGCHQRIIPAATV
jgi:hypothetical protein